MTESLGQRIARLRRLRGWTQYDLAAEVGVGRAAVTRWERDVWPPKIPQFMRLSAVLEIQPLDLWGQQP